MAHRHSTSTNENLVLADLINDKKTIPLYPSLVMLVGLCHATFLQQIGFLAKWQGKTVEGRRWIFKTYAEWQEEEFPWMNRNSIRKVFYKLEHKGLIDGCDLTGSRGEIGYALNAVGLRALYDKDPTAACEPDHGMAKKATPRQRKTLRARALCTTGWPGKPPPPADGARALSISDENVKRDLDVVVDDDGVPPAPPELVAALTAAGITDPQAIALRFPNATVCQVEKLHRLGNRMERNGKLSGSLSGFVISGLREGYQPDPPPTSQPGGVDQDTQTRADRRRDEEQQAEADRREEARARQTLAHLTGTEFSDLLELAASTLGGDADFHRSKARGKGAAEIPNYLAISMARRLAAGSVVPDAFQAVDPPTAHPGDSSRS